MNKTERVLLWAGAVSGWAKPLLKAANTVIGFGGFPDDLATWGRLLGTLVGGYTMLDWALLLIGSGCLLLVLFPALQRALPWRPRPFHVFDAPLHEGVRAGDAVAAEAEAASAAAASPQPEPQAPPPPAGRVQELEAELEFKRQEQTRLSGMIKAMKEYRQAALAAARKAKHEQSSLASVRDRPIEAPGDIADQILKMLKKDWSEADFLGWMTTPADEHDNPEEMPDERLRLMYRRSIRMANHAEQVGNSAVESFEREFARIKSKLRDYR
jgi:hypothetical protein